MIEHTAPYKVLRRKVFQAVGPAESLVTCSAYSVQEPLDCCDLLNGLAIQKERRQLTDLAERLDELLRPPKALLRTVAQGEEHS